MACGASLGAIVKRKCHQEPTTANSERIVSRKTAGRPTLVCRGCAINARWLRPTQKRGPTRLGQVVDSALNGGEPSIRLEVSWTSRALRQRGGAGESALSIRRHDRRPRSSAFDGITPPEPVPLRHFLQQPVVPDAGNLPEAARCRSSSRVFGRDLQAIDRRDPRSDPAQARTTRSSRLRIPAQRRRQSLHDIRAAGGLAPRGSDRPPTPPSITRKSSKNYLTCISLPPKKSSWSRTI